MTTLEVTKQVDYVAKHRDFTPKKLYKVQLTSIKNDEFLYLVYDNNGKAITLYQNEVKIYRSKDEKTKKHKR
jgi:hypothetical protein